MESKKRISFKELELRMVRVYTQADGVFICGKIREVRRLLQLYACRYRTVQELIVNQVH